LRAAQHQTYKQHTKAARSLAKMKGGA
jgi:hypothetical protein